ncbi:ATP-binding protein [Blastococcus saxobsidens]|uniref:Oxygen sensor histidine kinase NreB n=1 Tax=Blastococcus saxobsidens (strain DD2) TaxID=1146883 RepID=H6RX62_BLASD|nr:ATP-binding protein [Blastococcus saxobsidens]CCG03470.1 putative PAS domain S-box protein [Blastococcus saxobsidens DD2]
MERAGRAAGTSAVPRTTAAQVLEHAPDGLVVIDAEARFVEANPAAVLLCGLDPDRVAGNRSPFPVPDDAPATRTGELTVAWEPAPGQRREFAYVVAAVPGQPRWIVSFRDVTLSRLRERRLAAIAKAASNVASKRSLVGTLEALAQEVARTDALAGVQVLTVNSSGDRLHVMGVAGFGREVPFFDKLMECRALGARLMMLDALESREPLVAPNRYEAVMRDPAWRPLHEVMRHPRWDWFVSVPLLARGEPVGILNAFFAPGQIVGDTELEFLLAMAEQAAMAVDHAALMERERDVARREERQKLARDLHDSVVQQVFSMMMQARSLGVLVARGLPPTPDKVAQVADDLSTSAEDVLADLRGMVVELRPAASTAAGLASALRSLVDTTGARTDLAVSLDIDDPDAEMATLDPDLLEDVYRVVAEALHNSVKHARASAIHARVAVTSHGRRRRLVAEVADDGCGLSSEHAPSGGSASSGFGMTVMRERAARWGGAVRVRQPAGGGTSVLLSLPLPTSLPVGPADDEEEIP